jgi:hypothetical protein
MAPGFATTTASLERETSDSFRAALEARAQGAGA